MDDRRLQGRELVVEVGFVLKPSNVTSVVVSQVRGVTPLAIYDQQHT